MIDEAVRLVDEVIAFTLAHGLVPDVDGECRVGPAPPSRRWAMAMISPSAPFEDDAPSWYYITPPEPSWPIEQQQEWLSVFSATTLPAITVHEVAPGHFAHFRGLRRIHGEVRRALLSNAFIEGWAHYAEELCLEEGFRADDPRYAAGVALEALVRVTRLAVAIGLHTGSMSMDEAVHRFEADAHPRRAGGPLRGRSGHLRSRLRLLHLGQARDPHPSGRGPGPVGTALFAPPVPPGAPRAGRPSPRAHGYRVGGIGQEWGAPLGGGLISSAPRPWRPADVHSLQLDPARARGAEATIARPRWVRVGCRSRSFVCPMVPPYRHWSSWDGTTAGSRRCGSWPIPR